ncbi:Hint domain-containing protein [Asaia bogorensis]|uniref:Hint domain-containing protein n=1 Tax=Asaia bogorensis TaxID=91915 RepID=UPI000EFD5788|nr:Hint domain-containing protein [Asaia bogorensis]
MSYIGAGTTVTGKDYTDALTVYGTVSGGNSVDTTIMNGGAAYYQKNTGTRTVSNGGKLSGCVTDYYATENILSGGAIYEHTVRAGGSVYLAGSARDVTISTNAYFKVMPTGSLTTVAVDTNGVLDMTSAGTSLDGTVINNGIIQNGSAATTANITNGSGGTITGQINAGSRTTTAGGTLVNCTTTNAGRDVVATGGLALKQIVNAGGSLGVAGVASGLTVNSRGIATVSNGGIIKDANIAVGATVSGLAGGRLQGAINVSGVVSGGSVYGAGTIERVFSGATIANQTVMAGATVAINNGGVLAGTLSVQANATAIVDGAVGGTIDLAGASYATLTILSNTMPSSLITGFNGTATASDSIKLVGLNRADVVSIDFPTADTMLITMRDGSTRTLNIKGIKATGYTLGAASDGSLVVTACFLPGTMIHTPAGPRAVETLRAGDLVCVIAADDSVSAVPVEWIGVGEMAQAQTTEHYPVRICRDAIAENVPDADLLVTAEHCFLMEGRLVPIRMLVNGDSIRYETDLPTYSYYHIKTPHHSVLLANNTRTESYLDARSDGCSDGLQPLNGAPCINSLSLMERCAPLDTTQAFVEPLAHKLAARAKTTLAREPVTREPDLHLLTDTGRHLKPLRQTENGYIFQVPGNTRFVRVRSRSDRPDLAKGPYIDDRRELGVLIGDIHLYRENGCLVINDHRETPYLEGWSALENTACRWTAGDGLLPVGNYLGSDDAMLSISVLDTSIYREAVCELSHAA